MSLLLLLLLLLALVPALAQSVAINEWQTISNVPLLSSRSFHCAVYLPQPADSVFVFGGIGYDSQVIDGTFLFTFETLAWNEVNVPDEEVVPSGRVSPSCIAVSNTSVLLFGGLAGISRHEARRNALMFRAAGLKSNTTLGDTWLFDLPTLTWTLLKTTSPSPSPRYAASALYEPVSNTVLLFSGFDIYDSATSTWSASSSDIWIFSLNTMEWSVITGAQGGPPPPRGYSTSALTSSGLLVVSGCATAVPNAYSPQCQGSLQDMWLLASPTYNTWSQLSATGDFPKGIMTLSTSGINDTTLVSSSVSSGRTVITTLDIVTYTWTIYPPSTFTLQPPPEGHEGASFTYSDGFLFFFDGMNP